MVDFQDAGAVVFEYGNAIREQAQRAGFDGRRFQGFIPLFIRPNFCVARGPMRWVALSGDPPTCGRSTTRCGTLRRRPLVNWITIAKEHVPLQGLPARTSWLDLEQRWEFGTMVNQMVSSGPLSAPVAMSRDHLDAGSVAQPTRETENMADGSDPIADWPVLNALLNCAGGADLVALHQGGGSGMGGSISAGFTLVFDGTTRPSSGSTACCAPTPGSASSVTPTPATRAPSRSRASADSSTDAGGCRPAAMPSAMLTVGIDTGGTFTDVFINSDDGRVATVKVPTTPHDLTVCFADAIRASADALELPLEQFLRESGGDPLFLDDRHQHRAHTLGTAPRPDRQRGGPGGPLRRRGRRRNPSVHPARGGGAIDEEIGPDGEVRLEPDPEQVARCRARPARARRAAARREPAQRLGEPGNERAVKHIIDESYPRHYLGALPVLLSTQIGATFDDARRTASAVVNGYMHQKLATSLYRAEDDLRRGGFRHPLLIVNTDGGVTRVAKTRALPRTSPGPRRASMRARCFAGSWGSRSHHRRRRRHEHRRRTDRRGEPVLRDSVEVGGVPVLQPSVELLSFAIGGGSIARVKDGRLEVGPESAGAAPGPACFGLGGRQPTPTDAWLVLGYLTPDYYLGGRKRLDVELARRALATLAEPLGLSVEHAALAVCDAAEQTAAAGIEDCSAASAYT